MIHLLHITRFNTPPETPNAFPWAGHLLPGHSPPGLHIAGGGSEFPDGSVYSPQSPALPIPVRPSRDRQSVAQLVNIVTWDAPYRETN